MFSTFQKKIAAIAITCISICVIISFVILGIKLFGLFLAKFSLVVWPLATALMLSIILKPAVDFLHRRFRFSPTLATFSVFAFILILLGIFLVFALPALVHQVVGFAQTLPDTCDRAINYFSEHFPFLKEKFQDSVAQMRENGPNKGNVQDAAAFIGKSARALLSATGTIVAFVSAAAAFAVVPIYLYYTLVSKRNSFAAVEKNLSFMKAEHREDLIFLMKQFAEIMCSFFRGQLLIALIMGVLLGLGFGIAGIKMGFVLGFAIGIINLIPYLGTIIGLSTVLPLAYFQDGGSIYLSLAALVIFCLVQLIEAYLLTPRIMGDRTGMHPMMIIFSVFFWGTALNGILGMVLAIPLSAFLIVFWKLFKERYLPVLFSRAGTV